MDKRLLGILRAAEAGVCMGPQQELFGEAADAVEAFREALLLAARDVNGCHGGHVCKHCCWLAEGCGCAEDAVEYFKAAEAKNA